MMDSFSTRSLGFAPLESPPTSVSSGFSSLSGSSSSVKSRWRKSPDKNRWMDDEEFGQLRDIEVSEPFYMKFYYINSITEDNQISKQELCCQLDDFMEVPIVDAEKCLEYIHDDRILLETLHIEIKACDAKSKEKIMIALKKFAERKLKCKELVMVKRLVFYVHDFTFARGFEKVIAVVAPRPFEVNIGIAKEKVFPLQPTMEASYVAEFLRGYLQPERTWEIVRVLRIFNFITLDETFQQIIGQCRQLRHLTLSNLDDINLFEAKTIQSVLLDSCDFSNTMYDFKFAKYAPRLFPNAKVFGYFRCDLLLSIKALDEFRAPRIGDKRKEIFFHQPNRDFRKFLYEATKNFEILNDEKELEGEIQIQGHNSGPVITVFNKDRGYKTS